MMNATLRGKPDAGNPHVRFDEGEVASAKPRRGSLLYRKLLVCALSMMAMALSVSAAESCDGSDLIHRWSFNGSLADAVGGKSARLDGAGAKWNDAANPTAVTLAGGARGTGAIDLGYDCIPTDCGEITLEIFAQQNAVSTWSRIFDWGQDTSNYLLMTWTESANLQSECLQLSFGGTQLFRHLATLKPYTLGTPFHISARVTQRANGGLSVTFQKRDGLTGALLAQYSTGTDTLLSMAKLNDWTLWLGRSWYSGDYDAAATYDEVRIWKKSLTDAQLAWSARLGADTLPTAAGNASTSTISASASGNGTVAFNGGEAAATASITAARSGGTATLVATPAAGAIFRRWTGNLNRLTVGTATDAAITIDTARDAALVAEFVSSTEPMIATWTGAANNGDPSDAANWDCRNQSNAALPGALPTAATAVTIDGDNLNFSCPAGTTIARASLSIGNCKLAADADWRGLGEFTIEGKVDLDGHTLRVARLDGNGVITSPMSAVAVPALVSGNSMFWLDAADSASLNVNADGALASMTSRSGDHRLASVSGNAPTLMLTPNGRPALEFGATGSNRDLMYTRFTNIRTVFWVMKIVKAENAFLLGDRAGGNGSYQFHRGASGQYVNTGHAKIKNIWNGTTAVNIGNDCPPDSEFAVLSAVTTQNCNSDSLTYDRNISTRNGGRQLSEVIFFNTELSDADRTTITQYLQQKWLTGEKRAAGTLRIDVPAGASVVNSSVRIGGNLQVFKDGEGLFSPSRGCDYYGGTEATAGMVKPGRAGGQSTFGIHGTSLKLGADVTYDVNGQSGYTGYPLELAGATVINTGAALDGSGPFGATTLTADSFFNLEHSAGFQSANVDLGGHVLDVNLSTKGNYFCFNAPDTCSFKNGTLRVRGDGALKIWSHMPNSTDVDMDLDCSLWMCWTTTVHNLTFRYRHDNHVDLGTGRGSFRVGGTFKPMTEYFVRAQMLDGSTLDITEVTGEWNTQSHAFSGCGSVNADHRLAFASGATVTIDLHGRTLQKGNRVLKWSAIPANVTFQWDAATAALDATILPVAKADGLYYGEETDPNFVAVARWTNAAGDGDWGNAANWTCENSAGAAVADGVPGAGSQLHFEGDFAVNVPPSAPITCARVVVGNGKLTADCDWRGLNAPIEFNGVLDLHGHTLRTKSAPAGTGEITSLVDVQGTAPAFMATDAVLWLDASDTSTLTIENGNVTKWKSKGSRDITASASGASPVWNPRSWGRPCVDFGATGSNRDMTYPRFTALRTVFLVLKIEANTAAFLLGDSSTYQFHRDAAAYGHTSHVKYDTVWNGLNQVNWSKDPIPPNDFQVISITTTENCNSDSLTRDRNISGRHGGRQIFEVAFFERVLSNAERTQVTEYLQQKWQNLDAVGNFMLEVPENTHYENRTLKISGNLKFTKEGDGTFVAACKNQTYFQGNALLGGTSTTILSGSNSTAWDFNGATSFGNGALRPDFVVGAGATFDTCGNYDGRQYKIVLDGGTLSNRGCAMNLSWGSFGTIEVTADSTFAFDYQTTMYSDKDVYTSDLHGNTLTVEMNGQNFYPYLAFFTNGTMRLVGNGQLVTTSARDWSTVNLHSDGPLNLGASLAVRDYTSTATTRNHSGAAALDVYGTFTPLTDNFYGCTLQNGATLCLTNRTATFSTTTAFSPSRSTMTFANDATITVDIRGRTLARGDQLVAWSAAPTGVTFQWDAVSAETATEAPLARVDGLYYGGEPDMTVTDAVWTGSANDGNSANPLNWTCRNAAGAIVEGGLPGAASAVHVTGKVAVNFPVGSACTYREYDFRDITLTADCDWRGLESSTWGTIDLNGHKLYVSSFPASGTVTTAPAPAVVGNASFWLDAANPTTIGRNIDNKVTSWTSKASGGVTATAALAKAPRYDTTTWAFPTVDFGAVGSNLDMTYNRFSNLRTVFWVVKIQKTAAAFLLGFTGGEIYHFHRGDGGTYGSTQYSKFATVWNGTRAVNIGSEAIPDNDFQIISATMSIDASSNSLTNDRNIGGRSGGRQLSELICFNSVLSDADRTTITQYLQNKWFGGGFRGELHIDVPAGKTVVNSGVLLKDSVRLVKEGEGVYVGNRSSQTYGGGNEVKAGTIRPAKTGTQYVFGAGGSEIILREGGTFEHNGMGEYTVARFVLDGGTIRNTGSDLKDCTALGKVTLTADSRLEPTGSLSIWWDQHFLDLGGHTLTIPVGTNGKHFCLGANTTTIRNGTLDITSGGWFRVYHGALDASTVSLRIACAIDIADDAGTLTVRDYTARYVYNYNNGTNIIKVLNTFKPAAGTYFRGCELQDGATLDISEQTGVFSLLGGFTNGAKEMTFAANATAINVVLGQRDIPGSGKIVDWTGRTPANLANMKFTLDAVSRRLGRRLVVKSDGLYIESGFLIFIR